MKVRELIEKLQTCDPELEVFVEDYIYGKEEIEEVISVPQEVERRRFKEAHVLLK